MLEFRHSRNKVLDGYRSNQVGEDQSNETN